MGDEEVTTRLRRNPLTGASPVRLALILGTSLTVALTAVCGWLGYQTIEARKAEQTRDTLLQVARQGAVNPRRDGGFRCTDSARKTTQRPSSGADYAAGVSGDRVAPPTGLIGLCR